MLEALGGFAVIGLPILVGYLVARLKILAPGTGRQLNLLVFYVLIPFMLFTLMARADLWVLLSPAALDSFTVALISFALYALVAGLVWRRGRAEVTVGALSAGYANAGHIGLPVALHLLGDATFAAPIILFQTALFAPVALAILDTASGKRERPLWKVVLHAVFSPIVIGSLGGVLVSLLPWTPPPLLLEATDLIGQAAIPVVLIAFGMSLRGRVLLQAGPHRAEALLASALKLLAMPMLAYALGRFAFGLDQVGLYAVTTLAALPTAQNVFNYATRYQQSTTVARDAISLTTLCSAPLILAIAGLLGPGGLLA
ncbi:MAG: AEC family transporter [Propionibacteriaceae bacterium]|jgi:predicted permease|nr:AEC family transporter [Propionibacteriaceae bacterium]